MTTTISEILRQIEGSVVSMSEARRICFFKRIKFNGVVVEWIADEVDLVEGATIAVGKREWVWDGEEWQSSSGSG